MLPLGIAGKTKVPPLTVVLVSENLYAALIINKIKFHLKYKFEIVGKGGGILGVVEVFICFWERGRGDYPTFII